MPAWKQCVDRFENGDRLEDRIAIDEQEWRLSRGADAEELGGLVVGVDGFDFYVLAESNAFFDQCDANDMRKGTVVVAIEFDGTHDSVWRST